MGHPSRMVVLLILPAWSFLGVGAGNPSISSSCLVHRERGGSSFLFGPTSPSCLESGSPTYLTREGGVRSGGSWTDPSLSLLHLPGQGQEKLGQVVHELTLPPPPPPPTLLGRWFKWLIDWPSPLPFLWTKTCENITFPRTMYYVIVVKNNFCSRWNLEKSWNGLKIYFNSTLGKHRKLVKFPWLQNGT